MAWKVKEFHVASYEKIADFLNSIEYGSLAKIVRVPNPTSGAETMIAVYYKDQEESA